ncbi:MAG: DUF7352 domain-containing protein [Terriglobales bacterium]
MRTIWKYVVKVEDRFEIEMPRGAELLNVQVQHGIPVMWAVVVPGRQVEKRTFRIVGTGHILAQSDAEFDYLGTFQLGDFVGHVFEEKA